MNFKINVKSLLDGITPAYMVATTGVVKDHPTADHIALRAEADCLYVIANGGRVSISNPITFMSGATCTDYQFKAAGEVTVAAGDTMKVLSSFDEKEVLVVDATEGANGAELSFRPQSDPEQVQTLPIRSLPIYPISPPSKVNREITLNRNMFVKCIDRIMSSGGYEEGRERYLYWVLRADTGKLRFAAGTGKRFSVLNLTGASLLNISKMDMLIPVEVSQPVIKVMKDATSDLITIRQSAAVDERDHSKNRYSFEAGDLKVVVAGFNPNIKWITEDDILHRKSAYRVTAGIKDWELAAKGIFATNNSDAKDFAKKTSKVHSTMIAMNCPKMTGQLQASGSMKALRKIKLSDVQCGENTPDIAVRVETAHLEEIGKHKGASDFIQFEFAHKHPMLVRFNANANVTDGSLTYANTSLLVDEEFVMFFGLLNE